MKVFYDFEFLEDGSTIMPISIGMVDDVGHELYAVNQDMNVRRVLAHPWLREHVWPHLPVGIACDGDGHRSTLDYDHPDVRPLDQIRDMVHAFLKRAAVEHASQPQLWGYYPAYDHVCLAQLWGPMVKRPECMPMTTFDLVQELYAVGLSEQDLPAQPRDVHHALADARWTRQALSIIRSKAAAREAIATT